MGAWTFQSTSIPVSTYVDRKSPRSHILQSLSAKICVLCGLNLLPTKRFIPEVIMDLNRNHPEDEDKTIKVANRAILFPEVKEDRD